ncbi:MAG: cytochrome c [Cyclobacteriaceae bacterium]
MKQLFPFAVGAAIILTLLSFRKIQSDLVESIKRGKEIYSNNCLTCHMDSGEGIEGVYPPLAKSDYLMADKNRSIQQILEGSIGTMTVNGIKYNGFMTPFNLNDQEVSDVLNYVRNSWGNKGGPVTPAEVKALR